MTVFNRVATDTGLTVSSSIQKSVIKVIADTGLVLSSSISETLALVPGRRTAFLFGKVTPGASPFELAADTKQIARFNCPVISRVGKLSIYLDGQGSGIGPQVARGIIYNALNGALVAVGDEFTVQDGQAADWVDVPFLGSYREGVELAAQNYDLGLIAGPTSNTIRLYGDVLAAGSGRANDAYVGGPSDPTGLFVGQNHDLSIYASTFAPWTLPADVDDFYIARLPFAEAQAQLGLLGGRTSSATLVTVGWHGTQTLRERGSFAVVQLDGDLEDEMLGQRVKITVPGVREAVIYAFVSTAAKVEQQITVSRRLFQELATLGEREVLASIQVVPRA